MPALPPFLLDKGLGTWPRRSWPEIEAEVWTTDFQAPPHQGTPSAPPFQAARDVSVKVKVSGEAAHTFLVDPYRPIWKLKREIRERWDLDGQLRLSFQEPRGERKPISNPQTLADHDIFAKVSISVLETQAGEIQVFVKHPNGQTKPYAVSPEDSIYDLKEKIESAGGPPVEEQSLKFPGHKVWNNSVLADLEVQDGDMLTLLRISD